MSNSGTSRSDAAKGEVLAAIKGCEGCQVEAPSYRDLRTKLGLEHISLSTLRSALFKLVTCDHALRFYTRREGDGFEDVGVTAYGYRMAA